MKKTRFKKLIIFVKKLNPIGGQVPPITFLRVPKKAPVTYPPQRTTDLGEMTTSVGFK